jgi:hypothetical protein
LARREWRQHGLRDRRRRVGVRYGYGERRNRRNGENYSNSSAQT